VVPAAKVAKAAKVVPAERITAVTSLKQTHLEEVEMVVPAAKAVLAVWAEIKVSLTIIL
jgi:hypothetical protein